MILRDRHIWPAFAVATILFYFAPLFLSSTSIHWDLADVNYPAQKYVEESFRAGKLPFWSPYLNSGTPFLADPQSGAWYPLHWPFFLIGITPRMLVWELALHTFLALGGTFLLVRRLLGSAPAALMASLLYAWGGYFAGRSSQLSKFEAAALLPWLLWSALSAMETGSSLYLGLAGLSGGLMVLAGDFPSWLFSWVTLVLFAAAVRPGIKRAITTALGTLALSAIIGAIVVWPEAAQLAGAVGDPISAATLSGKGLVAIFSADYWGVITGLYKGPEDMRQFYLYSGLLLVPLFLAGLARRQKLWVTAALVVPPLILAFAGTRGIGSPLDAWFIAALGLALTAGSGIVFMTEQMKREYLWMILLLLTATDLWFWNMYKNPLTYARVSYNELDGDRYQVFQKDLEVMKHRPFYRLWSTTQAVGLGPADSSLLSHTETSYASGFVVLNRYASYVDTVRSSPLLLNDLAITNGIDLQRGTIVENPAPLERVTAPPMIEFVASRAEAHDKLKDLDPSQKALVEAPTRPIHPQGAELHIANYEGGSYGIETRAPAEFLLKLAVPFHPGWHAAVDGAASEIFPVDEALCGVFVPAGQHRVTFVYEPLGFYKAALLSGVGLLLALVLSLVPSRFSYLLR